MTDKRNWDWREGKRQLADLAQIGSAYSRVDETVASPDGEKIALLVKTKEDDFTVSVNGESWPVRFELGWHVRFSPLGRLIALVRIDDEWTIASDGEPWSERFEYAWSPQFSADGKVVAVSIKRDNKYGISVEDRTWEASFLGIRSFSLGHDGSKVAATVQVKPLKEADVPGFFEGTWSLAWRA